MYSNQPTSATFVSSRKKIGLLEKQKRELTVSLSMFEYEIKRLKIKNRKLEEENRRLNGDLANQSAHFVQDKRQLISDVQVSERNRYRSNESSLQQQLQLLSQKIEEQDAVLKKQYKNNYVLSLKLNVAQADLSKARKNSEKFQRKYEKEVHEKTSAAKQAEDMRERITSLYDQKDSDEQAIKDNLENAKKRILELEREKKYEHQTFDRIKHELGEKIRIISREKELVQVQCKHLQKDHQEAVLQQVRLKREITDVQHSKSHIRTSLHQTMHKLKVANHEIRKLKNTTPSSSSFSNSKASPTSSSLSTPFTKAKGTLFLDTPTSPVKSAKSSPSEKVKGTLLPSTNTPSRNQSEDLEKGLKNSEEQIKKLVKKLEESETSSVELLRKYNDLVTKLNENKRETGELNRQMKSVMYKNYTLQQKLAYQQKRNFKHYDMESLQSQFSTTKTKLSKIAKQYQLAKVKIDKLKMHIKALVEDKKKWFDQKVNISSELEREKYVNQILRLKKVDDLMNNEEEENDRLSIAGDKENYQKVSPYGKNRKKYDSSSLISISSGGRSSGGDLLGYDFQMLESNFTLTKQQLLKERDDLREVTKKLMNEQFQLKQKIMKKNSQLEDAHDQVKELNLKNSNLERKCKMLMTKLKETLEANQMWKEKFSEIHQNMLRLKKILAKKNIDLEKILNYFSNSSPSSLAKKESKPKEVGG